MANVSAPLSRGADQRVDAPSNGPKTTAVTPTSTITGKSTSPPPTKARTTNSGASGSLAQRRAELDQPRGLEPRLQRRVAPREGQRRQRDDRERDADQPGARTAARFLARHEIGDDGVGVDGPLRDRAPAGPAPARRGSDRAPARSPSGVACPSRRSAAMASCRLRAPRVASATSAGERSRCSASSRSRKPAIARATRGSPRASSARLHSVSVPIERSARLAEPIISNSSSTMSTLLWMLRQPSLRVEPGQRRVVEAVAPVAVGRAQQRDDCGRATRPSSRSRASRFACRAKSRRSPARRPRAVAARRRRLIRRDVKYWFSAKIRRLALAIASRCSCRISPTAG